MADGNISQITLPNGSVYDIKDTTSGFITGMTILSYGSSTWQDFIDAYNANKVVYCRASSNSNPASGSQTRLAFMAYVNNATAPTEVEFQYYRSVSTHTASQQGDQVYVYKLNRTNGWSVTVREASVKVVAGTGLGGTYSRDTMTLTGPTKVSDLTNDSGFITDYTETDPVYSASAASGITSSDISNWNSKTSNTGTITSVKTTAGAHTTINVSSGAANFNVPTKTSHLTNDSGFITSYTDEKLKIEAVNNNIYYPIVGANSTAASIRQYDSTGFSYSVSNGTTTSTGCSTLILGNNITQGNANNKEGRIKLYSPRNGCAVLYMKETSTSQRMICFPDKGGTVALTSDIPTAPTITLNGTSTTTPSFYAPTTAGTNGYFLKSNGSGAPTWAEIETTAAQIVRW